MFKDIQDCDEQKPRAKQEQTESGSTNLSDCDAAFARLNRKCEVQQLGRAPCSFIGLTNDHAGLEAVNRRKESGHQTKQQCEYGEIAI